MDFATKIATTVKEIHQMLKTPYPIQRQEKYLVENVDMERLLEQNPVLIKIEQYVEPTNYGEIIFRKSERDGEVKYTKITKTDTTDEFERKVTRKNITEDEYQTNLPQGKSPIQKRRYCFSYANQYFRLDIFDSGLQILEIEETNKTKQRKIPSYITVSDDVTTSPEYRNVSIYAKKNEKPITNKKK